MTDCKSTAKFTKISEKMMNYKEYMKQIEKSVDSNLADTTTNISKEMFLTPNNVKLEQFDDDDTQYSDILESGNSVSLETDLLCNVKSEPQVEDCDLRTDNLINESITDNVDCDTEIKTEQLYIKTECFDYEVNMLADPSDSKKVIEGKVIEPSSTNKNVFGFTNGLNVSRNV